MTVNDAIQAILNLVDALKDVGPLPRGLIGTLGELYFAQQLDGTGQTYKYRGGSASVDFIVNGKKVEVKTSSLKNESLYPEGIDFWGWSVPSERKKFTTLICIALDKDLAPTFYSFSRDQALSVPDVDLGWLGVRKKIHLFRDQDTYRQACAARPELLSDLEEKLNEHRERYQLPDTLPGGS
jgi:hypothetical protein